jgi:hydrogenase-4 component F
MIEYLFILPVIAGLFALFLPAVMGRGVLVLVALAHLCLTLLGWMGKLTPLYGNFFRVTSAGMLVLLVTSFIFTFISIYAVAYVSESKLQKERVFISCMLLFLGTMSMVALSDHPIMLWIAIEATTLVSAPLIFIKRSKEALEATWKYVMICSVGIALALLGCFFITLSMDIGNVDVALSFSSLNQVARQLDPLWLKTGFVFVVIGFGTKMGLAPMHTWLPDAHSQAPSSASALLSGALLNCAFLGIYKVHALMNVAGLGAFSSDVLVAFGLLSVLVAGIFILNQPDYKRMLAYSSIENMGIIAFGFGVGGVASFGAVLHLIHHSLLKSSLFLSSGNILMGFGTKLVPKTGNLVKLFPTTFISFFAGFAGISGFPPFGIFISEILIIIGAFQAGRYGAVSILIFGLILVFAGAARIVMDISFRETSEKVLVKERFFRVMPSLVLLLTSICLCLWLPDIVYQKILRTIAIIGGGFHG